MTDKSSLGQEGFAAHFALECLSFVFFHVFTKIEGLAVLFAAQLASGGLVFHLVVFQLLPGDEPFVALFALKDLVLLEDQMRVQAVLVKESPVTSLAFEHWHSATACKVLSWRCWGMNWKMKLWKVLMKFPLTCRRVCLLILRAHHNSRRIVLKRLLLVCK